MPAIPQSARVSHDAAQIIYAKMAEHEAAAAKATREATSLLAELSNAIGRANQATIARNKLAAELDNVAPEDFTGLPLAYTGSWPAPAAPVAPSRFDKNRALPFPPGAVMRSDRREDGEAPTPPWAQ